MQMHGEGKSLAEIRSTIERKYRRSTDDDADGAGAKWQVGRARQAPMTTPPPEAFARLFEAVHEGVYIGTLSADAAVTLSANPHLKLMFGYAAETPQADVRPFDAERFVDPQARDGFLERLRRDGAVTDYLLRLRRADGTPMWVEVTAHAEPTAPTARCASRRSMRDVSERKRLDDQARDLYHQLLQAEKLAALGQTISGVAHELNNPLATILTWAERLAQRRVDDQTRRGLETILERVRARRAHRPQPADVRAQAADDARDGRPRTRSCARRWRCARTSSASATSTSSRRSPPGLPPVFADPHQIQQVLLNLIINAEQAMLAAHGRGTLDRAHVARRRSRRRRARGQRRRARRAGGRAADGSSIRSSRRRRSARARASA